LTHAEQQRELFAAVAGGHGEQDALTFGLVRPSTASACANAMSAVERARRDGRVSCSVLSARQKLA
jgi:hypothetical protein